MYESRGPKTSHSYKQHITSMISYLLQLQYKQYQTQQTLPHAPLLGAATWRI